MRDRYILFCLVVVLFAMLTGVVFKHQLLQQIGYNNPDQIDDSQQEIEYLQANPGSENYQTLPEDCPVIYQEMPQYYFYTAPPYYVPGVSIWLGSGFWYTPGCNFVFNYTYYSPAIRPIPHCHGFYREPMHLHRQHAEIIIQKPRHDPPRTQPPQHEQPRHEQPRHERDENPHPRQHEPMMPKTQPQPRQERPKPQQPRHEQPHFQPHHSEPPQFYPPHKK